MKKEKAEKILRLSREFYQKSAREFSSKRPRFWEELSFIVQYLLPKGELLDLGCGNGRLVELLNKQNLKGLNYTGMDFSPEMLKEARRIYPGKKFILGDALKIPCQDGSFDAVVSIAVLHHIPSKDFRQRFFRECARVLKKDGVAVITVWNLWKPRFLPLMLKSLFFGDPQDLLLSFGKNKNQRFVRALTKRELKKLAEKNGFEVEFLRKIKSLKPRVGSSARKFKSGLLDFPRSMSPIKNDGRENAVLIIRKK